MSIALKIMSVLAPGVVLKVSRETATRTANVSDEAHGSDRPWQPVVLEAFFSGQSELYFEIGVESQCTDWRAAAGYHICGVLRRVDDAWQLRTYRLYGNDEYARFSNDHQRESRFSGDDAGRFRNEMRLASR
ncbi:hypothetical protein [Paraburkholderia aspalathi]|uniref:hypothetical protein n=1 Tax=Paraburkholderia aspalathi TaxID=1324617 RepID=UPI003CAB16BC